MLSDPPPKLKILDRTRPVNSTQFGQKLDMYNESVLS